MLVGKSDQLDNVDLISGPRDFTITAVSKGPDDQPLNIMLAEYDRPWRPGLTMRRLLAAIWGKEADDYIGHRIRLFRDPEISFGNDKTGGTRLSHASHLKDGKRITVSLPKSKGKFGAHTVEPMPAAPVAPAAPDVATITDQGVLKDMWQHAPRDSAERSAIEARVAELKAAQTDVDPWADHAAAIAARDAGETA